MTRSGIIESVHTFASTNVGIVFLSFLTFVIAASVALMVALGPPDDGEQAGVFRQS